MFVLCFSVISNVRGMDTPFPFCNTLKKYMQCGASLVPYTPFPHLFMEMESEAQEQNNF